MHPLTPFHEQARARRAGAFFGALALVAALGAQWGVRGAVTLGLAIPAAHAAETSRAERATERDKAERKAARKKADAPDTAFGREGDPRKAKRVIRIDTSDTMRYFPDHVTVKKGHTVRFDVRNGGALPHEMVIGTMDDLKKHAATVRNHGEIDHDDANVVRVEPGSTGRIVWHFTRAGEFYYGCLVPGHFDAGMIGTIVVR